MTNGHDHARPLWTRLKRALGMKVSPLEELPALDEHGAAPVDPRSMFGRLVDFASLRVDDVMVPRADIEAIAETASVRELLERFAEVGHSRLPVYRETLDDLAGMVHIKDFTAWVVKKAQPRKRARPKTTTSESAPVKAADLELKAVDLNLTVKQAGILREILFVPPSMPAADLLVKMQSTHIHMAVVVDEYGGTDGLVSIEDLVEQIVGDIADEHDEGEELIRPFSDGIYAADARASVEEVERLAGTSLVPEEHEEDVDTLGGLVVAMLGRVPVRGELIKHPTGIEFEVTDADPRRLRKLRIHLKPSGRPAASAREHKASA